MLKHDFLVIRITGDSGDGIQLIGQHLMMNAAMNGFEVRTLPDFPAEIRAPAGTVAGVSGIQLAIATHKIETAGDKVNILFAMNPAALVHSLSDLADDAHIYINSDQFTDKDWQKAKANSERLSALSQQYRVRHIGMNTLTIQALAALEPKSSLTKKSKNFYVLGLLLWLLELTLKTAEDLIAKKFQTNTVLKDLNQLAVAAGYHYGMTQDWQKPYFCSGHQVEQTGDFRQINGAEAIGLALATLGVGLKKRIFVAGYPITPSSAILHECAKLHEFNVDLFQAEDEIAAICACLGAAYGGHLALTTTSGPGFDLKMEGMGLGVASELPLVILDVQRAGVSTGLPTKTSQSDLRQALYGRHGESPLPVLAAKSPSDCFHTILEAFCLAVEWMTPVVVLLDAYLMNASEPWMIPDPQSLVLPQIQYYQAKEPFKRLPNGSRSWNPPGHADYIHQLGGLEKQGDWGQVSYDADNHAKMNVARAEKLLHMQNKIDLTDYYECDTANLLVSWGSTYGAMKTLVEEFNAEHHIKLSWLHLRHLNPLPLNLDKIFMKFQNVIVFELNSGHLLELIRAKFLVDAKAVLQYNGRPFSCDFLAEEVKKHIL